MSTPTHSEDDEGGGIRPGDVLVALRRRVWLIVLFAAAGGLLAGLLALSRPNIYEATATVQIDPRKKTIVSLDAVLPDIAGDTPTIESQVEILRSRVIALRVIDALGLRTDPEFGGRPEPDGSASHRAEEAKSARSVAGPAASSIGADRPERDVVASIFLENLKTVRVRNSLVVEINFRSKDPVKAARIANTIAEVYIRDQIDMKTKATNLASELLSPKLDSLRSRLAEAEQRIARFKAEHGIFDVDGQSLAEKQLARVMEQSVLARNLTAEARARYERLQGAHVGSQGKQITEVLQSHTVRDLKDKVARASKNEAELLTKYGIKHPEIAKVRAELSDLQGQLRREVDQIVANVRNEYNVAAERERMLEESVTQMKEQQTVTKEVTVKLRDLEREADTSRRIFEAFLGRYKQTVETQDLHLPDARIVEKADVPFSPVAPKRKQILLIGLIAGLAIGAMLALALELARRGLSRPKDSEAMLGLPLLAEVPALKRQSDGFGDPATALRIVLAQPAGVVARQMRKLLERLSQRRSDAGPRIILVTASLPNEGTTVVASNLALQAVAQGQRTLIIDGDLRRSKLSEYLGLGSAHGLIDAIALGQEFESVILRDTASGLAVIPAGQVASVALPVHELLAAPGFAHRLARLKLHFETIVIDAPALLPVVDSRLLASYADEIVLVATWRRTPLDVLRKAVQVLGGSAALLAGVVLNHTDPVMHAKRPATRVGSRPARRAA